MRMSFKPYASPELLACDFNVPVLLFFVFFLFVFWFSCLLLLFLL